MRYFTASASTSVFRLVAISILRPSIAYYSSTWRSSLSILLVVIVYISTWVLHGIEFIVPALVSLRLVVVSIVSIVSTLSLHSCLFSVGFRYDCQRTVSFVVSIIDLLFLSSHEILFFICIVIHVSVEILRLSVSNLIVWIDIIINLRFNLLVDHSWSRFLLSLWAISSTLSHLFILVLIIIVVALHILDFNRADVSSLLSMFVSAKITFARIESSCTLMRKLSVYIILLMEKASGWKQMTLSRLLIGIKILEWRYVTIVFISTSHWSFWHSRIISVFKWCNWNHRVLLLFIELRQRLFKSIIWRARICTSTFSPLIFPVIAHKNLIVVLSLLELAFIDCLIKLVFLILVNVYRDFAIFCFFVWRIFFKRFTNCSIIGVKVHRRLMHGILILRNKTLRLWMLLVKLLLLWMSLRHKLLRWVMLVLLLETGMGSFILRTSVMSWWVLLISKYWFRLWLLISTHVHNSRNLFWFWFWTTGWRMMISLWLLSLALLWVCWWRGRSFIHVLWLLLFQLILWLVRVFIVWISLRLSWAHLRITWVHISHTLVNSFSYRI